MSKSPGTEFTSLESPAPHVKTGPRDNPLDRANWLQKVTLLWLDGVIRDAHDHGVSEDRGYRLPKNDRADVLADRFDRAYALEQERCRSSNKQPMLYRPLFSSVKEIFFVALAAYLFSAAFTVLQPLVVKSLLLYLQDSDNMFGIVSGYGLAAFLVATALGNVTALDYAQFLTTRMGLNLRTIAIDAMYRKMLRLTAGARQSLTSGDILTLTGVDSERLFEAGRLGMFSIMSPLILITVCILLGIEMGWQVGLAAFILSFLILAYALHTSRQIGSCRRLILEVSGKRVNMLNEVLQGVRVVKMYAWEDSVNARVQELRKEEIRLLRIYDYLRVRNVVLLFLGHVLMNAVCFFVYIFLGNTLTVPTTFSMLTFSGVCRVPFSVFSNAVVYCSEGNTSLRRISAFLAKEELDRENMERLEPQEQGVDIEIRDGDFDWAEDKGDTEHTDRPLLSNINLSIEKGSLTVVVGAVGSGKSSLVSAILGEMHKRKGTCAVRGSVAYASQQPWILHNSVRENITFGTTFDKTLYQRVLSACQLKSDLAVLQDGDQTEIGERGINLSGGQKARVTLARVMYRKEADIMILDDPLSALDVHVANSVFFDGVMGLAKEKTCLLVLNAHYHLLPHADRILVLDGGEIVGDGTFNELKNTFTFLESEPPTEAEEQDHVREPSLDHSSGQRNSIRSSMHSETEDTTLDLVDNSDAVSAVSVFSEDEHEDKKPQKLWVAEDQKKGSMGMRIYTHFLGESGHSGVLVLILLLIAFGLTQVVMTGSDYYVTFWSEGIMDALSDKTLLYYYLGVVGLTIIMTGVRSIFLMEVFIRCGRALHNRYFVKVLLAPVNAFFDVTPLGRILNRFSRDLDQLDSPLPYFALQLIAYGMTVLSVFVVCAVSSYYTLILYVPLVLGAYYAQRYFQKTARDLKRIDGVTRSPFLNLVSETTSGIESIRSFGMTRQYATRSRELLDHNSSFYFLYHMATRWYSMRVDWAVVTVVVVVSFTTIGLQDSIGAGSAGIALSYAIQLTMLFQRVMLLASQVENYMTSYERISFYGELDEEGHTMKRQEKSPPSNWPTKGSVTFDTVSMRYRPGLDLVLQNVSFHVQSGQKIGVCGRTGSGKSTIMNALFRVVECSSGRILIDNVDISTLSLQQLRSNLTIIPQDPVLFSGTLRYNLDPFDEQDDAALWDVLRKVHLKDDVDRWDAGLEYEVTEQGDNLSVGQRQLLCIARALLRPSKIMVLDEATANVDQELDRRIQLTVKENFADRTTLTIAHRLETIADSDLILVLDHGRVQEYDSPKNLLQKPNGVFAALMESAAQH